MRKQSAGKMIGYARVSTEDQELRMQLDALQKANCWNIYQEKRSATRGKRPQLALALMDLRPGDTLVVWKLDRLVRNARQLYTILDEVHSKGANFKRGSVPTECDHDWDFVGGCQCPNDRSGSEPGYFCSRPVYQCTKCHVHDNGENEAADSVCAKCRNNVNRQSQ